MLKMIVLCGGEAEPMINKIGIKIRTVDFDF